MHHGDIGRRLEVEQVAVESFSLSVFAKHLLGVVVQSGKLRLIGQQHRPGVGGFQHVLSELQGELRQTRRELTVCLFVLGREVGTVVGEAVVYVLQHLLLLFGEFEFVALVVYSLDTFEQTFVQAYRRRILRHLRREFHL